MQHQLMNRFVVPALAALSLCATATQLAEAQNVREKDVYVWITSFDAPPNEQPARMYHEDSQGNLVPLGQESGRTSIFSIRDLLLDDAEIGNLVWFRGVSNVRVMFGLNPLDPHPVPTQDVSDSAEARCLIQHCVLKTSGRTPKDPCNRVWPIASGNELTSYAFEDIGGNDEYAMQFDPDDTITAANWLWANPANIAINLTYAWYLRFTLVFDLDDEPVAYRDVNVSWISADYCGHDFCLPANQETEKIGPEWQIPTGVSGRIVAAVPVLQDHSEWMKLMRNEDILFTATPDYPVQDQPSGHHCNEPDQPLGAWHTSAGHFDVETLQSEVVMPGDSGPMFTTGDLLWVHAWFDVPASPPEDHSAVNQPINGRALWIVFWEPGS